MQCTRSKPDGKEMRKNGWKKQAPSEDKCTEGNKNICHKLDEGTQGRQKAHFSQQANLRKAKNGEGKGRKKLSLY
jgi:hypothetical protein